MTHDFMPVYVHVVMYVLSCRFHLSTQNNLLNQPMLVNEYFHVVTSISNSFDVALQNVGLSITVAENFRNKGIQSFLKKWLESPSLFSLLLQCSYRRI